MTFVSGQQPSLQERTLQERIICSPKLAHPKIAHARVGEFLKSADHQHEHLKLPQSAIDLLSALADHSPYLWRLCSADPARLIELFHTSPEASLELLLQSISAFWQEAQTDTEMMRLLRRAKHRAALLIALADLGGVWTVDTVTSALSSFADAAVSGALKYSLKRSALLGHLRLDEADPTANCGLVVLALGKHGACELNYSSDVDLVVFYDPLSPAAVKEPAVIYVKIAQALARLLQERTADGYVLRVDYRLRPDPGSTNVAVGLPSAFNYYEMLGQNWERAAFIKARPIAGEVALGDAFLEQLTPFIWRKYFDYAAIADIHAMKRQIHIVRGHSEIAVAGHDIKLGRGGIREVEFFVQTQQLIYGGRRPSLRGRKTLDMLEELYEGNWITIEAAQELAQAYRFLRSLEHRLQMISDEQTQRLPVDMEPLKNFARFCGYVSLAAFSKALLYQLSRVQYHYARLFEHSPNLGSGEGSLVFTGSGNDPATLDTLQRLGFVDVKVTAETIRGWHFGRRKAVQSARSREVLTELTPTLLTAFGASPDPDAALAAFDQALGRMSGAVELFSILKANEKVLALFADILGSAPRLAQMIANFPHVLDAAIDADSVQFTNDGTDARIKSALDSAPTTEDFLDRARSAAMEEGFLIGLHFLAETFDARRTAQAFSDLASAVLQSTLEWVKREFKREHGQVPGGQCAVVAFGKLGSREMTAVSDLDLVLLYDFNEEYPDSSGTRPLHASVYYTRLTQRLVSALTVQTRRGALYDVDMRLRPSGKKGPLATKFKSFVDYQRSEAETWEHMSLTRARVVAGDDNLRQTAQRAIASILRLPREDASLRKDVTDMRLLITKEKGEGGEFDLKLARGGLMDIEFIAQYLVLTGAAKHETLVVQSTEDILFAAEACRLLSAPYAEVLLEAHRLYTSVSQMLRITIPGQFEPKAAGKGVLTRIAQAAALPDFKTLERSLSDTKKTVRKIFIELV